MADPTDSPTASGTAGTAAAPRGAATHAVTTTTTAASTAALADARRTPTMLLLNPNAGGGRAEKLQRAIEACLAVTQPRPMFFRTDSVRSARRLVDALPAGSRVIIAGGDGSVQQMLPSLILGGHTLGLVPIGSGNDTARALGVAGKNWRKALDIALHAPASTMDIGEISYMDAVSRGQRQSVFLSSLAVGFDASVTAHAAGLPGWLTGMPRYLMATLIELAALRRFKVQISADSQPWYDGEVLLSSSLNTSTYGGGMAMAPMASDSDGKLDLMLAEGMGLTRVLRLLPAMLRGRHVGRPGVRHLRFSRLEATPATPMPIAVDGEYLGEVRTLHVTTRAGLLSVVRKPTDS